MTKVLDFDAFRSEQEHEPVILRLGGKEYPLPAALPAALALDIARMNATRGPDADFSEADVMRLGSALFGGEDRFLKILSEGAVTLDEMPEFTKRALEMYGPAREDPAGNREARRARAKSSRSSKSGRSSKQTS